MYSAMAEFFSKGGAFMYPIALVFVLGVAIASERYLYLTLSRARNRRFWQQLVPLLPMQDQLAALRDNVAVQKAVEARNLSGRVGEQTRSERSLVTSGVGVGSGGIDTSTPSRGYGGGAGSLDGHATTHVAGYSGSDTGSGQAADDPSPGGSKPARSREEIELVFDRNKSAIYALYSRALRSKPALQRKLVLELTIAPSGEVIDGRVVSSQLGDPELERKLVTRVRMSRFEESDVEIVTTTRPIDFFPA